MERRSFRAIRIGAFQGSASQRSPASIVQGIFHACSRSGEPIVQVRHLIGTGTQEPALSRCVDQYPITANDVPGRTQIKWTAQNNANLQNLCSTAIRSMNRNG